MWQLVTEHVDANVVRNYERELDERVASLELLLHADNYDDEHIFVERVNNGVISEYIPRYNLKIPSYYSRLKLPIRDPEYTVPIRQGFFTAISAWVFRDEEPIKLHRQLLLLDYTEDKKTAVGRHITVF